MSTKEYNHLEVEQKWQTYWDENKTFEVKRRENHPKKYVLDMFPYPSGAGLHVGHPEGYTATDIMSRYWRMKDFDVLHPMGWDAFGLPAEQHAINTGTHPAVTTGINIGTFKRQLKSLGFSYDWTRELSTTDEGYVKWTQWIFLQLYKAGLAAQSEVSVNWCPALGTVLANEEVIDGLSERGSHPVVRLPLRQWVFKITEYADKLEEGLKGIDWPEGTLTAQKGWIGKSVGATIKFKVDQSGVDDIEVFTTRPDTIMGVTYVVVAPESPLVNQITTEAQKADVDVYVSKVAGKSDMERTSTGKDKGKTGVWTGAFAVHPLTKEKVPVWVADYVLAGYGTGSVMAVPAHDERDFAFATLFGLPIKQVVTGEGAADLPMVDHGVAVNSGDFDGLSTTECKAAVIKKLAETSNGGEKITYKLRDWVFSRQRYWGEPIPIYFPVEMQTPDGTGNPINGDAHKIDFDTAIPVAEEDLPLKLPDMTDFQPGDDPQGCLARAKDWRYFQKDGKWFARETNTMPQWAGSCWYYLRFADPHNTNELISKEAKSWLPVDLYVGGQEHAVLHLLYARFWHKVLYDIGVLDHPEPFVKLVHQGMILGSDGEKMSKSRGNVINPDDVVQEHGADALRLYEMFMGPLEATKPWQTNQLAGVVRFRERVFSLLSRPITDDAPADELLREMHKTIKKVTSDVESLGFNTAISSMMVFSSTLAGLDGPIPRAALENLVLLLSPFAPHVAEECWERLGHKESLAYHAWPQYDEALCIDTTAKIAVQINGKVRATLNLEIDMPQDAAVAKAKELPSVTKFTDGKDVKKIIYVPGRILNIVCK
jgi:leucyl-tRNA synthetase